MFGRIFITTGTEIIASSRAGSLEVGCVGVESLQGCIKD